MAGPHRDDSRSAIALAATLHRSWRWTPGGVALLGTAILFASYFPLILFGLVASPN